MRHYIVILMLTFSVGGCAIFEEDVYHGFYDVSCQHVELELIGEEVRRAVSAVAERLQRPVHELDRRGVPEEYSLMLLVNAPPSPRIVFSFSQVYGERQYDILVAQAGYEETEATRSTRSVIEDVLRSSPCSEWEYSVRHGSPFA